MRRVLEPDHDLLGEDEPPRDLVLGAPALVGIFLAVVLICAVCFGFGYSSGHGFHLGAAAAPQTAVATPAVKPSPVAQQAADNPVDATPHPDAAPTASEPVPDLSPTGVPISKPTPGVVSPSSAHASQAPAETAAPVQTAAAPPVVRTVPPPVTVTRPAAVPVPAAAAPAASMNLMVQIAAVTQASDAETLARALRHDGFDAIVRTTTGDPYFHVQVGPFAGYEAAKAMRSRLAADGYTAFIRK